MRRFAALILLLSIGPATGSEEQSKDAKVDYNRDIQPILANNCLLCHGPDAKGRKGDDSQRRHAAVDGVDDRRLEMGEPEEIAGPGQRRREVHHRHGAAVAAQLPERA